MVCYLSRSLNKNERKFSTTEKECLAVLFAVEKLRPYRERTKFTVVTYHYSLKWLHSIKDPVGRIARWSLHLQQYDSTVVHRKGRENVVPDALSRSVPAIDALGGCTNDSTPDKRCRQMCSKIEKSLGKYPL